MQFISKAKLFIVLPVLLLSAKTSYAQAVSQSDSITVSIAPAYDSVGKLHRRFFGEGYRKCWAAPVTLRVCYLSKEKGGLAVVKRGGGLQTRSLRLKDTNRKEWVLRTIQKYPEQGLPPNIRNGLAKDILQDQVVTAHPFASVTIPPLADAVGVPHANPEIIYLAADTVLGEFNKEFANAVYLLEEREPAGEADTDNTEKVQQALQKNHDVSVEQQIVVRARLLDMILGDWDRHEDQWRWKKEKEDKNTVYTPVPRDRDMVYYNTTGIFPWIVSHQWLKSKFQGFHENIRDINGFNVNARYFDRYFLNEPDEAAWRSAIAFVKNKLTDSLITAAVHLLPDTIFKLTGELLIHTLIARRNNIDKLAIEYYRFISKVVEVPASGKQEYFSVGNEGGNCLVQVNKLKKNGTISDIIYKRSFDPAVTKEIRLYGMDGNDVFVIDSNFSSPIKIRMTGGSGKDSFMVNQTVNSKRNLFVYDRKDEETFISNHSLVKRRLRNDSLVNSYNKRSFKYDRFALVILANYSLDEGILFRAGFFDEKQGFRKEPYAFRHELLMNYSFARKTFLFTYNAVFKKLFGNNDLVVDVNSRGPQNLSNFFGIGNEAVFVNKGDQKISYYRSRYDYVTASVQLNRPLATNWRAGGGIMVQYYTSSASNNTNRFFDQYNNQYPGEKLYQDKIYGGVTGTVTMDTRNDEQIPTRGIYWNTSIRGMQQLNGDKKTFGHLLSECSFYADLFNNNRLVVANRIGAATMIGDPSFFQLMQLGGAQTMRGFHTNRFSGKTALYNNLELRLKLFDFNSYVLPGTVGLISFNDVGRVWLPGESSSQWHDSYGTGLYIVPARLVVIQGVVGFSKEGSLPYISVGFRF